MASFSRFYTKESLLIGVLIGAYLLPIWVFTYFPTQDGVSHVYNSQILTEYTNPEYPFRDYYEINWYPFPNWLSHFSLAALMFIFPSLIAEKIFLSLYVILFPTCNFLFPQRCPTRPPYARHTQFHLYLQLPFSHGFLQLRCECPALFPRTRLLVET